MVWDLEMSNQYPWRNIEETIVYPDVNSLQYINGVLRNTEMIPTNLSHMYKEYESGLLIYSIFIIYVYILLINIFKPPIFEFIFNNFK